MVDDGKGNIREFRLYNGSGVYELIPCFYDDLCGLFKHWNCPPEKLVYSKDAVLQKLRTKLRMQEQIGVMESVKLGFAEYLGNALYSLRVPVGGNKNLRVLFCLRNGKDSIILLCAFNEKDKKRGGRTSYEDCIPIAIKRMKEFGLKEAGP